MRERDIFDLRYSVKKDWNFEEQKMARSSKFRERIKKDIGSHKFQGH